MKTPRLPFTVFQSRIGKRIFWMFVGCSFLPIIILSALSYFHVQGQLNDQAVARLRQTTKSIGMSLYERLELVDNELRLMAYTLNERSAPAAGAPEGALEGLVSSHFGGLLFAAFDGREIPLYGEIKDLPALAADQKVDLRSGRSLLRTLPREGRPARVLISLLTTIDDSTGGILTGEIDVAYLWGIGQQYNLPPLTELTVMNQAGDLLVSSIPGSADLIRRATVPHRNASSHHFAWRSDHGEHLGCYWDLFLKSRFIADTWTIVLSQSRENALAVIQKFKLNFPLSLLVVFWVILLLSIRFIRRSLNPLEQLQEGTRRIHDGDFSRTVTVQSGDEFEDLAGSFNLMTRRLARTFGELAVMAEMGHYVTTRPEVLDLAATQLRIMADKLHFDWGLLMIQGDFLSGEDVIAGFGLTDHPPEGDREIVTWSDQPQIQSLAAHVLSRPSPLFTNDVPAIAPHLPPSCAAFLGRIECRSLLCVPISFENRPVGVLAVGQTHAGPPLTNSDKDLITGIATQTAVAINSIMAYHHLQESEARFRKAFDHAATGIALVSLETRIRASNRYLQQLLGYSEAQLVDHPLKDLIAPGDQSALWAAWAGLLSGEAQFAQLETQFTHQDGHAVPTRLNGSLIRDTLGQARQFILHIQDLSAEKAAEQDKRRLEGQLRQAQKMEAIGTLAGGIAHDFNNILAAVRGYTELALMRLPEDTPVCKDLTQVKRAADRATDLVRQILTFSRRSEQEKVPLQVGSVVKEALKLLRASLPATIEICKIIDNAPALIMADPTQIHQIVMNLCTNALHAMQEEGGRLEVRLERSTGPDTNNNMENDAALGNYVKMTVADTGCGMDKATLERIFDPYFTTKDKDKGTGLGLSLVHGIVENHGGAIRVSSALGQGTTFHVYFPLLENQTHKTPAPPGRTQGGMERVLFIDDEPMLVDVGKALLAGLGYQVLGMNDPCKAWEVFQKDPGQFDIVITDLTMPGITGDKLAEKLAALRPDIPILLCSGYVKHSGPHPFLSGYVHKPFTREGLACAVREALDRCQAIPSSV